MLINIFPSSSSKLESILDPVVTKRVKCLQYRQAQMFKRHRSSARIADLKITTAYYYFFFCLFLSFKTDLESCISKLSSVTMRIRNVIYKIFLKNKIKGSRSVHKRPVSET